MKKTYINIQIAIVAICIIFQSCKKEINNPSSSKTMKQLFYTEEGSAYIVKTVTKNLMGQVIADPINYQLIANVNQPVSASLATIQVTTPKRIIPVCANLAFVSTAGVTTANISSVYYGAIRGNVPNENAYDQQSSQAKMFPLVDQIFYTTNNLYAYNVRYTQAVFTDSDFIDVSAGVSFYFQSDLAQALTIMPNGGSLVVIPAGTYYISETFTFLELQ